MLATAHLVSSELKLASIAAKLFGTIDPFHVVVVLS